MEPSSTATVAPTVTHTPSPTITPTATATITPTPLPMPRLLLALVDMEGLFIIRPSDPPFRILPKYYVDKVLINRDGKAVLYYVGEDWSSTYPSAATSLRSFSTSTFREKILLTYTQILRLERIEGEPYAGINLTSIKWIPATHRIVFTTYAQPPYGYGFGDLFRMDADTGQLIQLRKAGTGGLPFPSPDGKKVALYREDMISIIDIAGNMLHKDIVRAGNFYTPELIWARDSSRFEFIADPSGDTTSIWTVDAMNGESSVLGSIGGSITGKISPNLDYMVYAFSDGGFNKRDVTLAGIDGGNPIRLVDGHSSAIAFSPDGSHFSFFSGKLPENHQPCVGNTASTTLLVGSLDGSVTMISVGIDPFHFQWVNNSQFIYVQEDQVFLGDIHGNATPIVTANTCVSTFSALDLDFQSGSIT